jgi:2-polyprenyl-6-methoxyphenol hydroxylase-like FAD-dependent oxidoreductase
MIAMAREQDLMSTHKNRKVLVVGGGIAGMAFATAAGRQGMNVDVVELDPRVVGVGIVLSGSTLRALETLGLAHECVRLGWAVPSLRLYDGDGKFLADNPMPQIASADLPASCALPRRTLADIFAKQASCFGVRVTNGVTVEECHLQKDSVLVRLSNGERAEYDLLVGADGMYSRVRELMFEGAMSPSHAGQGGWRFMTPRHAEVDSMLFFARDELKAGFVPLNNDWMYLLSTVTDQTKGRIDPARSPEIYHDILKVFKAPLVCEIRDRLRSAEPRTVLWRPFETLLVEPPWHRGNVILIGDAAHSMTPHLSSGGGMAIEDAVVLNQVLAHAGPVEPLLEKFTRLRIERVRQIYEISLAICGEERSPTPSVERIFSWTMRGYNALAAPFLDETATRRDGAEEAAVSV